MVAITKSLQRKTQTTFLSYLLGEKPQDSGDITTAIMSSFEDFKELLNKNKGGIKVDQGLGHLCSRR